MHFENRRKANMREHQLKGLISAFGDGSKTEEIEFISRKWSSFGDTWRYIYIYMLPEVILIRKGERYEPKHWDVLSMAMIIYFIIKT